MEATNLGETLAKAEPDDSLFMVEFPNIEVPDAGVHSGIITSVEYAGEKTVVVDKRSGKTKTDHWFDIWVDLTDQSDIFGDPIKVKVEVTRNATLGANIRDIFLRLGFTPVKKGEKFDVRALVGVEVDVFVYQRHGNNKHYRFAKVDSEDISLRGKGRVRPVAVAIPDDPTGVVIWNKTPSQKPKRVSSVEVTRVEEAND